LVDDGNTTASSGFDAAKLFRIAAIATAVLVLIQALMAGRGWFVDFSWIETHGWVGNVTFLAAVALAFLSLTGLRTGATDKLDAALAISIALLVFAQVGLGYGGRNSATAASIHIPTGVLIMGLTGAVVARSFPRRG
jgi:magnesium-transporting ATPase (P-type)